MINRTGVKDKRTVHQMVEIIYFGKEKAFQNRHWLP